jgi:hypothetical protein
MKLQLAATAKLKIAFVELCKREIALLFDPGSWRYFVFN